MKDVMDIKELSEYLGIGKSKIYSLVKQGKIPASKIGKQYRFSKDVVDQWLKEKIVTGKEKAPDLFELPQKASREEKKVEGGIG